MPAMPARLAQYLIAKGLVSAERIESTLEQHALEGGKLDSAILEEGLLSEEQALEALGDLSGHRPVNLGEFEINFAVSALIPQKIADRLCITPLSLDNGLLHVACGYPVPARELREVGFLLGRELELWVALEVRVRQWLAGLYGLPLAPRLSRLLSSLQPPQPVVEKVAAFHDLPEWGLAQETRELIEQLASSAMAGRESEGELLTGLVDVPEWNLKRAREELTDARHSAEQVLATLLHYGQQTLDFVAAFLVQGGMALGWDVQAEGWSRSEIEKISIPLDVFSVFRTIAVSRGSYIGPPPPDAYTGHFLQKLGRAPRTIFAYPLESQGKVVALLYGDCAEKPISQRRLSDLLLFCQNLSAVFQDLKLPTRATAPPTEVRGQEALIAPAGGIRELVDQLLGPDVEARQIARLQLFSAPAAAAVELIARFPGPSSWSRGPVLKLPSPYELGPIPGMISELGAAGAEAICPLLDSRELETRYRALLTAGSFRTSEFIPALRRALFDPEPDISSAARALAKHLQGIHRFDPVLDDLRDGLTSRSQPRRALAARGLGALHQLDSIDALIGLVGSEDRGCAQAAADALREMTKASCGTDARQWTAWWAVNRERDRIGWLLAGLRHADPEVRRSSVEELADAFGLGEERFGYFFHDSEAEQEAAIRHWESLA
jgi:hypothetical protein